ncbi:hypothetical protein [Diaphorobacter sp. J5-51]|uniref:hypothetical protein n=1 Tax=Diaphorobacter sp. J5-51 TaxID=680496 RepID=UPI000A0731D3|nr:hypothetical protein [Diaphorobacter sp. J5-51]
MNANVVEADVWPVSHSGGEKSISDDDLCSECAHCSYRPGEMSGCEKNWPGLENNDYYVVSCQMFQEK